MVTRNDCNLVHLCERKGRKESEKQVVELSATVSHVTKHIATLNAEKLSATE